MQPIDLYDALVTKNRQLPLKVRKSAQNILRKMRLILPASTLRLAKSKLHGEDGAYNAPG